MPGYWITFDDGTSGYCDGTDPVDAAKTAAAKRQQVVKTCNRLPYPARPIIHQEDDCPPFCSRPQQCQGRSSCPQQPACSE